MIKTVSGVCFQDTDRWAEKNQFIKE